MFAHVACDALRCLYVAVEQLCVCFGCLCACLLFLLVVVLARSDVCVPAGIGINLSKPEGNLQQWFLILRFQMVCVLHVCCLCRRVARCRVRGHLHTVYCAMVVAMDLPDWDRNLLAEVRGVFFQFLPGVG